MTRPYIKDIKAGNSVPPPASTPFPLRPATPAYAPPQFGSWWDHFLVRMIFAVACVAAGYHFHPFDLSKWVDAGIGLAFSISVFLFEIRLQIMDGRFEDSRRSGSRWHDDDLCTIQSGYSRSGDVV